MVSQNIKERLYEEMLLIRLCEDSLIDPILSGEVKCPVHLYTGEEAIAVGLSAHLKKSDYVFSNHRSHGHFLSKGGDLKKLMAEIYGKETGCSKGRGGSMHVISTDCGMLGAAPIVAGTISLALGAALASSIRKDDRVTVSFFGDGATGEGALYESLNFASLKNLPLIFACENNFYSTHMPILECRKHNTIYELHIPFKIKGYRVEGNDILSVYDVAEKAVKDCRAGSGPVFIEFLTYRQKGHVGPDDNIQGEHTDIRPPDEIKKWMEKDPIKKYKEYLRASGVDESYFVRTEKKIKNEVKEAIKFAKESPYPKKGDLLKYVFKE